MEKTESVGKSVYEINAEFVSDPVQLIYGVQGLSIDSHLQQLVRMVNNAESGLSFGITLFTASGVLTGNLISSKKYFKQFGENFASGLSQNFPDHDWQQVADSYADMGSHGDDLPEGKYECPPQFIHLEQARVLGGNGNLLIQGGALWRGKLQAVSGFTLGLVSAI
ncbi:hypothetical protein ACIOWE_10545 [Pseudomonas sp. NPDC087598]|uniref:hypothetical protein n=1 Tax=Pseudomonas sp. NPDC087598 TaxID=3364440 RepID=UPI00382DD409